MLSKTNFKLKTHSCQIKSSKKPLEPEINIQFGLSFGSLYLNLHKKTKKQLLNVLFNQLMYDGHGKERENLLRYLDLHFGYSNFFRKKINKVSRAHEVKRCGYSYSTTDRNRALARELGLVEIYNSKQESERHKNKISLTNIFRFKEILKEFKRFIPKKYTLLGFVLTSLGLTNINGEEHIKINMNNKKISITSKSNSKLISDGDTQKVVNDPLFSKKDVKEEKIHASTVSVCPSDMVMDWRPSKFFPKKGRKRDVFCDLTDIYEDYDDPEYIKWVKYLKWNAKNGKEAQRRRRLKEIERVTKIAEAKMKNPPPKNKELLELTNKAKPSVAFLKFFDKIMKKRES